MAQEQTSSQNMDLTDNDQLTGEKIFQFSKFSALTIAFLAFDWLKNSDYEPIVGVLRHMENSAPSLKIFRAKFSTSAIYNCGNKNRRQNPV